MIADEIPYLTAKDVKILGLSLGVVLVLVGLTVLAPVYVTTEDSSERHLVWNAPSKAVVRKYDTLSAAEKVRLGSSTPMKRKVLEGLKNEPTSYEYEPNYFGPLFGLGFNFLGYVTALCAIAWLIFFGYRIGILVLAQIQAKRKPLPKQSRFPLDVRRSGTRKR